MAVTILGATSGTAHAESSFKPPETVDPRLEKPGAAPRFVYGFRLYQYELGEWDRSYLFYAVPYGQNLMQKTSPVRFWVAEILSYNIPPNPPREQHEWV